MVFKMSYEWKIKDSDHKPLSGWTESPIFIGSPDETIHKWRVCLTDDLCVFLDLCNKPIEPIFVSYSCDAYNFKNELIANYTTDTFYKENAVGNRLFSIGLDRSEYNRQSITNMCLSIKLYRQMPENLEATDELRDPTNL